MLYLGKKFIKNTFRNNNFLLLLFYTEKWADLLLFTNELSIHIKAIQKKLLHRMINNKKKRPKKTRQQQQQDVIR